MGAGAETVEAVESIEAFMAVLTLFLFTGGFSGSGGANPRAGYSSSGMKSSTI